MQIVGSVYSTLVKNDIQFHRSYIIFWHLVFDVPFDNHLKLYNVNLLLFLHLLPANHLCVYISLSFAENLFIDDLFISRISVSACVRACVYVFMFGLWRRWHMPIVKPCSKRDG